MKHDTSLFPAYAGVIPAELCADLLRASFPRIRGGDPGLQPPFCRMSFFSPHTRG